MVSRLSPFVLSAALLLPCQIVLGQNAPPRPAGVDTLLAQTDEVQKLTLIDGSVLYGQVVEAGDIVRFRLVSGTLLELSREDVREVEVARGHVVDGEFRKDDPNSTRLFFGPTGRGLERGQGYLAVYELFIPFLSVAPANNLILSGGTPLLYFGNEGTRPFWFGAKARIAGGEETDVALGALILTGSDSGLTGIAYGVVTHGGNEGAVTAGIGYGFAEGELASRPVLMLGGELRATSGIKLISENYMLPGGEVLLSLGPRFFGERLTADLGLAIPIAGDSEVIIFPLVNFVWNW